MAAGPALRLVSRCATVEEFVRAFCAHVEADTLEVPLGNAAPASGTRGRVVVALANRIAVIDGDAEVTCADARITVRYTRLDARSKGLLAHLVDARSQETIAAIPRHLVPLGAPVGDVAATRDQPALAICNAEPLVAPASVPRLPDLSAVSRPTLARGVAVPPVRARPPTDAPIPRPPRPATRPPPAPESPPAPPLAASMAPIPRAASTTSPAIPPAATPPAPLPPPPLALAPPMIAAPVLPDAPAPAPAPPRRRRETQPTLMGVGKTRRPIEQPEPDTDPSGREAAAPRGLSAIESTFHGPVPMRVFDLTATDGAPAPMDLGGLTAPMTAPMNIPHELDTGETDAVHVGDDLATDVAFALPELPAGDDLDPLVEPPAPSSMPRAGLSMSVSRSSAKPYAPSRSSAPTDPAPMRIPIEPPIASVEIAPQLPSVEITEFAYGPPQPPAPPTSPSKSSPGFEAMPMYALPPQPTPVPPKHVPGGVALPMFAPQPLAPPASMYPPPAAVGSGTGPAPAHPGAWPTPGWSPNPGGTYPQAPPPQPPYAPPPQYPTAQLRALDYQPPTARSTPAAASPAWQRHRPEMPEDVGDMTEIVSVQHVTRRRRWPVIAITSAIVVALTIVAIAVASQSSDAVDPHDGSGRDKAVVADKAAVPDAPDASAQPAAPLAPTPAKVAAPPATSGPCQVTFSSSPDGAEVVIAGQVAGVTPVTLELPCNASVASFRRDRYQTVAKHFTPTPGDSQVKATLARPSFTLAVKSVPAGAKIIVGGVAAGTTPGTITVPGFEGTPVEIIKAGFAIHRERVYATKPGQRLDVRLRRK